MEKMTIKTDGRWQEKKRGRKKIRKQKWKTKIKMRQGKQEDNIKLERKTDKKRQKNKF